MTTYFSEQIKKLVSINPVIKKLAKIILKPLIDREDAILFDHYQVWLKNNSPSNKELAAQVKQSKTFHYQPLISIIAPTYNTNIDYLRATIESVINQTYWNWELIMVDDASPNDGVRAVVKEYADKDNRIKYKFLDTNRHIAGATNESIRMSSGEFISLFDHDDIMWPDAMYEIVKVLNEREIDFIYTDEDRIMGDTGNRTQPFFKPSWNEDFLLSINYITHLSTIRKSVFEKVGLESGDYNGAQDWELYLRIARSISKDRIYHLPKIVYSWRVHEGSTASSLEAKPYTITAQRKALLSELGYRGYKNFKLQQDPLYLAQWKLQLIPEQKPRVSLVFYNVIPSKRDLEEIKKKTAYGDFEILVFNNEANLKNILETVTGDYVVLINKKIKILEPRWLLYMLGDACREEIGSVFSWVPSDVTVMNLKPILDGKALELIRLPVSRFISKNFYLTCKYDVKEFDGNVVMINTSKLKQVESEVKVIDIPKISSKLVTLGYVNLYNPHIKC